MSKVHSRVPTFRRSWIKISSRRRFNRIAASFCRSVVITTPAMQANKNGLRSTKARYIGKLNSVMNIRPLYDRIIVKRIEEQETARNGIIIPDSAKEKPQEGEVMAVGHGKRLEDGTTGPLDVKAGDRILFGKYSGSETKVEGTEYIIMREDDVLAFWSGRTGRRKPLIQIR